MVHLPPAEDHNARLNGSTVEVKELIPQQQNRAADNVIDLNSNAEYILRVSARTAAGNGSAAEVPERSDGGKVA